MSRNNLTDDDNLGFLFADIARLIRFNFQQIDSDIGFTYAQARALVHVARNEGRRQVELADLMEVQPITLARLIDQLQTLGLVERRPDPQDRRAYRLYLTDAAEEPLRQIRELGKAVYDRMLEGVDSDQQKELLSTLKQVRRNLITD